MWYIYFTKRQIGHNSFMLYLVYTYIFHLKCTMSICCLFKFFLNINYSVHFLLQYEYGCTNATKNNRAYTYINIIYLLCYIIGTLPRLSSQKTNKKSYNMTRLNYLILSREMDVQTCLALQGITSWRTKDKLNPVFQQVYKHSSKSIMWIM